MENKTSQSRITRNSLFDHLQRKWEDGRLIKVNLEGLNLIGSTFSKILGKVHFYFSSFYMF